MGSLLAEHTIVVRAELDEVGIVALYPHPVTEQQISEFSDDE
jgi:hypothetical protein